MQKRTSFILEPGLEFICALDTGLDPWGLDLGLGAEAVVAAPRTVHSLVDRRAATGRVAVVVAPLAGAFGAGPLSGTVAESVSPLTVEVEPPDTFRNNPIVFAR